METLLCKWKNHLQYDLPGWREDGKEWMIQN